ncbi:hypothetical protein BH10BAC4_BH10BAC4_11490 [soil metagenome]
MVRIQMKQDEKSTILTVDEMKSKITRQLNILAVFSALCLFQNAGLRAQMAPPLSVQDSIQKILKKATNLGSVMSVYNRRENWQWYGTSGFLDTTFIATPTINSKFRIGSITKTFVAVAILKLVEKGILSLDDPIGKWLPANIINNISNSPTEITIRKLLAHTSGLSNFGTPTSLTDSTKCSPQQLMLLDLSQINPPNSNIFKYSNGGYIMLSQIMEKATGLTYKQVIENEIIKPLGLSNTLVPTLDFIQGAHMTCWVQDPIAGLHDLTNISVSCVRGDGDIISNTSDLIKFQNALIHTQIINAQSMNLMFTPVGAIQMADSNIYPFLGYGLGYILWDYNQRGHGGDLNNLSGLFWFNDIDVCVCVNFNTEGNAMFMQNMLMKPLYKYLKSISVITEINLSQDSKMEINAYPNPTSAQTTLQIEKILKNGTLTVYNSLGQTVIQIKNISGQTVTLHRDNLPSGLYFLLLTDDSETFLPIKLLVMDN